MSDNAQPPTRRRWFQFRLRTLLIAVAVLAAPMAWVGCQLNWIRERRVIDTLPCLMTDPLLFPSFDAFGEPKAPPWQLTLFGESGRSRICLALPTAEEVERVKRAYPEAEVTVVP